jgi:phosphomevalonate kinase
VLFKVPGNLLLLGEFAVTLEGGLGIACAVDRFVTLEVKKGGKLKIESSHSNDLILYTLNHLFKELPTLEIKVDSSPLFKENGDKMGLGSSAAVVSGLTFACLEGISKEKAFPIALEIHRAFQGGRGSGYDVAASLFGITNEAESSKTSFVTPLSAGLFIGGKHPTYTPNLSLPRLGLVSGKKPVSTKEMLIKFEAFQEKETFLKESNDIVKNFLKTRDLKKAFQEGKKLHETLHKALQIETDFKELDAVLEKGFIGKPLGSGYELGAFLLFS